jgi:hypothetical protein
MFRLFWRLRLHGYIVTRSPTATTLGMMGDESGYRECAAVQGAHREDY